jgi:hypothetical protein
MRHKGPRALVSSEENLGNSTTHVSSNSQILCLLSVFVDAVGLLGIQMEVSFGSVPVILFKLK